jgi:hypothetical protein
MKTLLWVIGAAAAAAGAVRVGSVSRPPVAPDAFVEVEAQPLVAQARRLDEALEALGHPFPPATKAALRSAAAEPDDRRAAALVHQTLEPYCLASLRVERDGTLTASAGPARRTLSEQGWRLFLVKVINVAGSTGTLRVNSPNALPLPNSPQSDLARRWMDLQIPDGRPLEPHLSGLELEYRPVLVYASRPGALNAMLRFNVGQPPRAEEARPPRLVREWTFEKGTDGWNAQNQSRIEARDGVLRVTSLGDDPYLAALVDAPGGRMTVRFRAKSQHDTFGQVYWWTEDRPNPDGERMASFPIAAANGNWRDYAVSFKVEGRMRGLRLDPASSQGWVEIQSISLSREDEPSPVWAEVALDFQSLPSHDVAFDVRDEHGKPTTAAFLIRDAQGRVYPAQSKRLAPDFYFHPQVYRSTGETVRLPEGEYTVHCSRGNRRQSATG